MKILMCHNYYQQPGGEDRVFHDESIMLESRGHEVLKFDVHNDTLHERGKLGVARDTIWNRRVFAQIQSIVRSNSVQVVHFHNTFPIISPSAYYAARRAGAAVVQTLHNYRLMCPGALLCRQQSSCSLCVGKAFPWPAIWHKCYRGDRAASAVLTSMLGIHHLWKTWKRAVDRYIACTEGARQRFIEGGLPAERIAIKPNFVRPHHRPGTGQGEYCVYVGRLAVEKGIEILLRAWPLVSGRRRLLVVGNGPLQTRVREAAESDDRIEYLGWRTPADVRDIVGRAECLLMPSIWIEGLPKILLESFAKGTPPVASRMGAMAETIDHGRNGLLFTPGDAEDLAQKVVQLTSDPPLQSAMRAAARAEYEEKYTEDINYQSLHEIYENAIGQCGDSRPIRDLAPQN